MVKDTATATGRSFKAGAIAAVGIRSPHVQAVQTGIANDCILNAPVVCVAELLVSFTNACSNENGGPWNALENTVSERGPRPHQHAVLGLIGARCPKENAVNGRARAIPDTSARPA